MFQNKTDYAGLSTLQSSLVLVRDDTENKTQETYQPDGGDGSYAAIETFGVDTAPSNTYGVKAPGVTFAAGDIKLGKITLVSTTPYALESVSGSSGPNTPVTLSATTQEVESGATDAAADHYSLPALAISSKMKAQIFFTAFSLSGADCDLVGTSFTASCQVSKDKVAGVKISSDIGHGMLTVSGTILQRGSTVPTVSATQGWTVTTPLTCSNPESQYKSWTFTVSKPLAKDTPPVAG